MSESKRILVAEDHPGIARVIKFNLERSGWDVTMAENGQEAWSMVQEDQFDMIVSDQQMPEMNGSEFCARMRTLENYADVPAVLLTAKGLEMDADWLRDNLKIERVFFKPFSPTELIDYVQQVLGAAE
jgi:CheY-like chemotaxis protein